MSVLSSATVLRLVDSMAILQSQAYQLARARLASAASPIVRLLVQRDQAVNHQAARREHAALSYGIDDDGPGKKILWGATDLLSNRSME